MTIENIGCEQEDIKIFSYESKEGIKQMKWWELTRCSFGKLKMILWKFLNIKDIEKYIKSETLTIDKAKILVEAGDYGLGIGILLMFSFYFHIINLKRVFY